MLTLPHFLSFVFLLCLLNPAIFADDTEQSVAQRMRELAQDHIRRRFDMYGRSYVPYGPYLHLQIPDFHQSAWEFARSQGVHPLEIQRPIVGYKSRIFGFGRKEVYGPRQQWFYSIIQPETDLGERMGLVDWTGEGQHKEASVVWKWDWGRARAEVVSVETMKEGVLPWKFENLEELLREHFS